MKKMMSSLMIIGCAITAFAQPAAPGFDPLVITGERGRTVVRERAVGEEPGSPPLSIDGSSIPRSQCSPPIPIGGEILPDHPTPVTPPKAPARSY